MERAILQIQERYTLYTLIAGLGLCIHRAETCLQRFSVLFIAGALVSNGMCVCVSVHVPATTFNFEAFVFGTELQSAGRCKMRFKYFGPLLVRSENGVAALPGNEGLLQSFKDLTRPVSDPCEGKFRTGIDHGNLQLMPSCDRPYTLQIVQMPQTINSAFLARP